MLKVLAKKPDNPPGEKYAYSNVGYTIAAAMAEKKTGATWEDLVKREVFEPLALTSAGFGPPKSPDETLPQPRGHRPYLGAKIPASDEADNSPIMGPAGSVHMSLSDLSTYATEHLRGHLGNGKLLSAETYQRLHAPRLNQLRLRLGREGSRRENSAHHLLAQRFEHAVVRAGGVHPREEHGGRRHLERRRSREGRSRRLGNREVRCQRYEGRRRLAEAC